MKIPDAQIRFRKEIKEAKKRKLAAEKAKRKTPMGTKYPHFHLYSKNCGWVKKYAVLVVELMDSEDYWGDYTVEYVTKEKDIAKEYAEFACERDQRVEGFGQGTLEVDSDGFEVYRPYEYEWDNDEYLPVEQDRQKYCRGEYYEKYIVREVKIWTNYYKSNKKKEKYGNCTSSTNAENINA